MIKLISGISYLKSKIIGKYRIKSAKKYALENLHLKNDFTIISNNCIGGIIAHDLGWKFLTPTINCLFYAHDYIKYLQNLRSYNSLDVTAESSVWKGKNIVLLHVGDLKLYFVHDSDCEKVIRDWNRRKERVNYDRIFIIASDRDGWDDDCMEKFKKLPYNHKCFFTVNSKYNTEHWVIYRNIKSESVYPILGNERVHYKEKKLFDLMKF